MLKKYGYVRVGAAVPKMKVADIKFNTEEIINQIKIAEENKIQIIAFPELCITGYTCQDLFHQDILLEKSEEAIQQIKSATENLNIIVLVGAPIRKDNQIFNTAIVIQHGKILGVVPKTYIPNYSEFYEKRWFASGKNVVEEITLNGETIPFGTDLLFKDKENNHMCFGVEICEDLWAVNPPSNKLALNGATIIFNLSASNEILGKAEYRKDIVKIQSAKTISGYIYVSSGVNESTTDVVFSGHALIYENGALLKENERFDFDSNMIYTEIDINKLMNDRQKNMTYMEEAELLEECRTIKIDIWDNIEELSREYSQNPFVPMDDKKKIKTCREILNIQSNGLAKRLKAIGTDKTVIGISGGLDSSLAFLVINKAYEVLKLDKKNIIAVTMPGFGTTSRTYNNAVKLIHEYGASFREIDITKSCKQHFIDIGQDENIKDVTYENAQARERTQILMDIANMENGIVVGTGDLSELAMGWCTYNGDHMSMYGVNCSIPKTLIKYLIKYVADESVNEEIKKTLYDILETPISPELLPPDENGVIAQLTEEAIGPYTLNDFFLYHFMRYGVAPDKLLFIAKNTFKDEFREEKLKEKLQTFIKRFFNNQFKRSCVPDGPKVGTVSLSPRGDWRMASDASYQIWL